LKGFLSKELSVLKLGKVPSNLGQFGRTFRIRFDWAIVSEEVDWKNNNNIGLEGKNHRLEKE
jgi:hypothetical protein